MKEREFKKKKKRKKGKKKTFRTRIKTSLCDSTITGNVIFFQYLKIWEFFFKFNLCIWRNEVNLKNECC